MNPHDWHTDSSQSGWRTAAPATQAFAAHREQVQAARTVEDDEQGWDRILRDPNPSTRPGMELYEPSQPAPKHNPALYGALLIIFALGLIVHGIRRMRPESKIVALCIAIAGVLIIAGKVG
jgi:hypothetical protein